jgi:hypothetical protein
VLYGTNVFIVAHTFGLPWTIDGIDPTITYTDIARPTGNVGTKKMGKYRPGGSKSIKRLDRRRKSVASRCRDAHPSRQSVSFVVVVVVVVVVVGDESAT